MASRSNPLNGALTVGSVARRYILPVHYGLILPTKRPGANAEAILATAQTAERLGWRTLWADDHILVNREDSGPYRHIYEVITTLAWWAGRRRASGSGRASSWSRSVTPS